MTTGQGLQRRSSGSSGPASRAGAGSAAGPSPESDPVAAGREICLRALTAAPRTRGELAQAMARKGVPAEAADQVLGRLTGAGLVDDVAFAQAWVAARQGGGRALARRALSSELRRRGVDPDVVQEALRQVDDADEVVAAAALVRRRLPATAGLETSVRVRRLSAMLARKGYSGAVATQVVRDALGDEAAELLEPTHDEVL